MLKDNSSQAFDQMRTEQKRPRFSVLIPTRDRPEYVRNALESVLNQSFGDFEVVVCDNFKERSCKASVSIFADPRVRYIQPPTPLAMHDNWEFAIDEARGDFVIILIDKTILRLTALERLQAATQSHPAEIYSWTSDAYYLTDEAAGDVGRGFVVPVRDTGEPFYVDSREEIEARLSFQKRIGSEGAPYNYGKICFGAYCRELIARIKSRFGAVCPPISPDYTSKTVALLSTERMVDLGGSYQFHLITTISNGMMFANSAVHARRFLQQGGITEKDFASFPIPNVFCSLHNICAYDLRFVGEDHAKKSLNLAALYVEVERDLELVNEWASEAEKAEIHGHMRRFFESGPASLRERIIEEKHRVYVETHALREKQLADREMVVKNREDYTLYRENSALARENAILKRERAALCYEAELQARADGIAQREQVIAYRETLLRRVYDELGWVVLSYRLARRAKRFLLRQEVAVDPVMPAAYLPAKVPAPPDQRTEPAASPGQEDVESAPAEPWPMQSGFPVFGSTISALRYAESGLYTFPVPVPPSTTPPLDGKVG